MENITHFSWFAKRWRQILPIFSCLKLNLLHLGIEGKWWKRYLMEGQRACERTEFVHWSAFRWCHRHSSQKLPLGASASALSTGRFVRSGRLPNDPTHDNSHPVTHPRNYLTWVYDYHRQVTPKPALLGALSSNIFNVFFFWYKIQQRVHYIYLTTTGTKDINACYHFHVEVTDLVFHCD